MQTPISNGLSIDRYIPPHLRDMFYKNPNRRYAIHNGYAPYGFSTKGLVLYLPLWALKGSAFKSVDAFGHTCTVTGALWRPDHRAFDGTHDINCGSNTIFDFTSGDLTLGIWFQPTTLGNLNYRLFIRGAWNVDGYTLYAAGVGKGERIFFETHQTDASQVTDTADSTIAVNTWYCIFVTRIGENVLIYLDGVDATDTPGVHTNPLTCSDDLEIGTAGGSSLIGKVGEAWIYNRALSAGEVLLNYNCTKQRYQ